MCLELSPLGAWGLGVPSLRTLGAARGRTAALANKLTLGPLVPHQELLFSPPGTWGWRPGHRQIRSASVENQPPGSCSGQSLNLSPADAWGGAMRQVPPAPVSRLTVFLASYKSWQISMSPDLAKTPGGKVPLVESLCP